MQVYGVQSLKGSDEISVRPGEVSIDMDEVKKKKLIDCVFEIFENDMIVKSSKEEARSKEEALAQEPKFLKGHMKTLDNKFNHKDNVYFEKLSKDTVMTDMSYHLAYMQENQIERLKGILNEKEANFPNFIESIEEIKELWRKHKLIGIWPNYNSNIKTIANEIFAKGEYRRAIDISRLTYDGYQQAQALIDLKKKLLGRNEPELAKEAILAIESNIFHPEQLIELKKECLLLNKPDLAKEAIEAINPHLVQPGKIEMELKEIEEWKAKHEHVSS